jgi:excisionase family DNA binding protein
VADEAVGMSASSSLDRPELDAVRLLTPSEVADALVTTPRNVRRLRSEGRLPSVVLGRRSVRYRLADVQAFIQSCMNGESPAANGASAKEGDDPPNVRRGY